MVSVMAQTDETMLFELQSDGTFRAADGKDYVILDFEGKTASELYQLFLSSAVKGYATERQHTREVENVSFAIEGVTDTLSLKGSGTLVMSHDYQVMFHFRDGRVKVDAPILTTCYASLKFMGVVGKLERQRGSFSEWVKDGSPFLKFKDGRPANNKYLKNWEIINRKTNELINCVLEQLNMEEGDW